MGNLSPKRSALYEHQRVLTPSWRRNELLVAASNVGANGQWPQRINREVNKPATKDPLPYGQQHSIDVRSLLMLDAVFASIRSLKDRKSPLSSASTSTTASVWGIGCSNSGFALFASTKSLLEWLQVYHDALFMVLLILLTGWLSNRSSIATSLIRRYTSWPGIETHRPGSCSTHEDNQFQRCNRPWRRMLLLVRASTSTILNISAIIIDFCTLRTRKEWCSWGELIHAAQVR